MATPVTSTYGKTAFARLTAAAGAAGVTTAQYQHQATMKALPPPTSVWRDHMGLSVTAPKTADIPLILRYGTWVRAGWEECWGSPVPFVAEAKTQGLKVIACLQPCNPNRYAGWDLARMAAFAQWCVRTADLGVEVIEVGNEMNNPTFNAARDTAQTTAALLTAIVADAVHAQHPSTKVISNGWSPMGSDANQYPQVAMENMLTTAVALGLDLRFRVDGCGYHPYEMKQLPSWDPGAHPGWNACFWMQAAETSMRAHALLGPICPTEYGKIGTGNDQVDWATDYLRTFERYRAAGANIDLMMWHTLRDGQSTLPGEGPMGVVDAASLEKPVGALLREQGAKRW